MEEFYITLINGEIIKPNRDTHFLLYTYNSCYSHTQYDKLKIFVAKLMTKDYDAVAITIKYEDHEGEYIYRIIPKRNILHFSKMPYNTINLIKHDN